jgi:hypothetical protein
MARKRGESGGERENPGRALIGDCLSPNAPSRRNENAIKTRCCWVVMSFRIASIDDFVVEVANARIYDGVHYRNSAEVGTAMGKKIGALTAANALRPAH